MLVKGATEDRVQPDLHLQLTRFIDLQDALEVIVMGGALFSSNPYLIAVD